MDKLVTMGWLLCRHFDEYSKCKELWHLVNPGLLPTVKKVKVNEFFMDLIHIAVELNMKLVASTQNPILKPGALKNQCVEYLKMVAKGKAKIAAKIRPLGGEITEEELITLVKPFFRSSQIRMELAGKEFEEDEISMREIPLPAIQDKTIRK